MKKVMTIRIIAVVITRYYINDNDNDNHRYYPEKK